MIRRALTYVRATDTNHAHGGLRTRWATDTAGFGHAGEEHEWYLFRGGCFAACGEQGDGDGGDEGSGGGDRNAVERDGVIATMKVGEVAGDLAADGRADDLDERDGTENAARVGTAEEFGGEPLDQDECSAVTQGEGQEKEKCRRSGQVKQHKRSRKEQERAERHHADGPETVACESCEKLAADADRKKCGL